MPESFRLEDHGLKKLRTDHFAGLVFGTLSDETPPLADYIGNLIGVRIGRVLKAKPKILGTTSQILHNNWKLYVENVGDTYHAPLLHTFFTTFRVSRLTAGGGVLVSEGGGNHTSYTRGKHDIVGKEDSDKLYADIQSMRDGVRLADPRLLDAIEEFGDDVYRADPQRLSEFRIAADQQLDRAAPGAAERAGGERAVVDLSRLRG